MLSALARGAEGIARSILPQPSIAENGHPEQPSEPQQANHASATGSISNNEQTAVEVTQPQTRTLIDRATLGYSYGVLPATSVSTTARPSPARTLPPMSFYTTEKSLYTLNDRPIAVKGTMDALLHATQESIRMALCAPPIDPAMAKKVVSFERACDSIRSESQCVPVVFPARLKALKFQYYRWLYHVGVFSAPPEDLTPKDVDRLYTCGFILDADLDFEPGLFMLALGAYRRHQESVGYVPQDISAVPKRSRWTIDPLDSPPSISEIKVFSDRQERKREGVAGFDYVADMASRPQVTDVWAEHNYNVHGLYGLEQLGVDDEEVPAMIAEEDFTYIPPGVTILEPETPPIESIRQPPATDRPACERLPISLDFLYERSEPATNTTSLAASGSAGPFAIQPHNNPPPDPVQSREVAVNQTPIIASVEAKEISTQIPEPLSSSSGERAVTTISSCENLSLPSAYPASENAAPDNSLLQVTEPTKVPSVESVQIIPSRNGETLPGDSPTRDSAERSTIPSGKVEPQDSSSEERIDEIHSHDIKITSLENIKDIIDNSEPPSDAQTEIVDKTPTTSDTEYKMVTLPSCDEESISTATCQTEVKSARPTRQLPTRRRRSERIRTQRESISVNHQPLKGNGPTDEVLVSTNQQQSKRKREAGLEANDTHEEALSVRKKTKSAHQVTTGPSFSQTAQAKTTPSPAEPTFMTGTRESIAVEQRSYAGTELHEQVPVSAVKKEKGKRKRAADADLDGETDFIPSVRKKRNTAAHAAAERDISTETQPAPPVAIMPATEEAPVLSAAVRRSGRLAKKDGPTKTVVEPTPIAKPRGKKVVRSDAKTQKTTANVEVTTTPSAKPPNQKRARARKNAVPEEKDHSAPEASVEGMGVAPASKRATKGKVEKKDGEHEARYPLRQRRTKAKK